MNIKCIGIGNRIMCDDGIAIKILESIKSDLEKNNIKVVIGETYSEYTFNEIENNEFIIIIDSTYLGIVPGEITVMTINEIKKLKKHNVFSHDQNLIDILNINNINVNGYFLGIEISDICYDINLSYELESKFEGIKDSIEEKIFEIIKEV